MKKIILTILITLNFSTCFAAQGGVQATKFLKITKTSTETTTPFVFVPITEADIYFLQTLEHMESDLRDNGDEDLPVPPARGITVEGISNLLQYIRMTNLANFHPITKEQRNFLKNLKIPALLDMLLAANFLNLKDLKDPLVGAVGEANVGMYGALKNEANSIIMQRLLENPDIITSEIFEKIISALMLLNEALLKEGLYHFKMTRILHQDSAKRSLESFLGAEKKAILKKYELWNDEISIDDILSFPPTQNLYNPSGHYSPIVDLSHRCITSLEGMQKLLKVSNVNRAVSLNLSHNKLTTIQKNAFNDPSAHISLPSLEALDLSHNQINILGQECFAGLTILRNLNLSNNRIHNLKLESFTEINQLQSLNLSNNHINTIEPYTFGRLRALESLNLDNNLIQTMNSDILGGLSKLETLNLTHNLLEPINRDTFSVTPKLRWLLLSIRLKHDQNYYGIINRNCMIDFIE